MQEMAAVLAESRTASKKKHTLLVRKFCDSNAQQWSNEFSMNQVRFGHDPVTENNNNLKILVRFLL